MLQRIETLNKGVFEGEGPANVTWKYVAASTQKNGMFLTPADWHKQPTQDLVNGN